MPQPSAVISVPTSTDASILSKRAFSTFRILPLSGRMAWVRRSRPCLAEPPAESPSTMNISHSAGSFSWQSASFPGRPAMSRAPLRRVSSRALRAASRARAASMILPTMALASAGCSSRNSDSLLRDRRFDHALHFRRDQLLLGLRGELRIRQLHREDGRETFARVVARGRDLLLFRRHLFFDVVVQRARERCAEAGEMGAAILLRNVVRVAEHRFCIRIVPLHGHFHPYCSFLGTKPENGGVNAGARAIQVFHELLQPALVLEHIGLGFALVDELDAYAGIQERQLAQSLGEDLVVEGDVREDGRTRLEAHHRALLGGVAGDGQRRDRVTQAEFHLVGFAVAIDGEPQVVRQRVDHRHADAMQAAGDLVRAVIELTAGMQHGHDDFGC